MQHVSHLAPSPPETVPLEAAPANAPPGWAGQAAVSPKPERSEDVQFSLSAGKADDSP